ISQVCDVPVLLVVPSSGPQFVADLVTQAQAKPGNFSFGSSGTGTATHLFAELFARETGTTLTHVPYKGSSQAVVDLLAARLQIMFSRAGTVRSHLKTGALRALAVSGRQRGAGLPDIST